MSSNLVGLGHNLLWPPVSNKRSITFAEYILHSQAANRMHSYDGDCMDNESKHVIPAHIFIVGKLHIKQKLPTHTSLRKTNIHQCNK